MTLTGVGGVGKTRLSIQVAAELTSRFADGVWLVEPALVSDPLAATLASLAVFFDRVGQLEVAAVVYGASSRRASIGLVPNLGLAVAHLREVLGESRFGELVAEGMAQETADAVRFAQRQIERGVDAMTSTRAAHSGPESPASPSVRT